MSAAQPNAWQTAGRGRHAHSASRTPQNRSNTASPSQPQQPSQPPRPQQQEAKPPTSNAWANRTVAAAATTTTTTTTATPNGPLATRSDTDEAPDALRGFNAAEVRAYLARDAPIAPYKPSGEGNTAARKSGNAWGSKGKKEEICSPIVSEELTPHLANSMANGQSFWAQLAKQIATTEGGG